MSVWNATTPDDATYAANAIHTQIQADKVMLSGRFTGWDGTIHAHNDKDSDSAGIHQASKVGWVRVHATEAAMATWKTANSPLIEGSLHFCTAEGSLHIADDTLDFTQIYPVDHLLLLDKDAGDDHNYQDVDLSKTFTGDVALASLTLNNVTGGTASDPLDEATHAALDWETAHGAATCHGDHIGHWSLIGSDIVDTPVSDSVAEIPHIANTYGFPWHGGDAGAGNFEEFRCYDTGFGFHTGAAWVGGTTYCGLLK